VEINGKNGQEENANGGHCKKKRTPPAKKKIWAGVSAERIKWDWRGDPGNRYEKVVENLKPENTNENHSKKTAMLGGRVGDTEMIESRHSKRNGLLVEGKSHVGV